jgi:hypothetical protein
MWNLSSELTGAPFRQIWLNYAHEVLKDDWLILYEDWNFSSSTLNSLATMSDLCGEFSVDAMYPIPFSPFRQRDRHTEEQNILLVWWRDGDRSKIVSPLCSSARNCLHETCYMQPISCSWFPLCMTCLRPKRNTLISQRFSKWSSIHVSRLHAWRNHSNELPFTLFNVWGGESAL